MHNDEDLIKSKSQLKREMHELQDLGKRMLDLSDDQLVSLPMSETLKRAIVESRRIRQHEARRRHLQYVGKVIRNEDDPEALRRAVEAFDAGSEEHTRRHHLAERWRDQLIAEGNAAVAGFVEQCPATDVQHLRNLVRNAQKDAQAEKNTGQGRKLFRYLRECIDEAEQNS
ncbi:ribosome biogenesis factor YjgA [Marinobacter daqiaonensis]|uniref:ribosome biogenesis factor YjgA n=1 Tax=Marinobacter daqiaonensis TaxID=650891 RepID=UPI001E651819|nr:ribosome biogenesis factor YjgA [Marinobacter daqiaonensis]